MKQRNLLKVLGLTAVAWMLGIQMGFAEEAKVPRKPNIILIFAYDLGWKDVGYQGSDFMETPNIDRLAMYAACTYALDAGVGLLLEKIKELSPPLARLCLTARCF